MPCHAGDSVHVEFWYIIFVPLPPSPQEDDGKDSGFNFLSAVFSRSDSIDINNAFRLFYRATNDPVTRARELKPPTPILYLMWLR